MFRLELDEIGWWYWAATALLLGIGLAGETTAFELAIALTAVQIVHFLARQRRVFAFAIQVRVAFCALLLAGQWPPLAWIYWISAIGTTALVLFGYCPFARLMSLMPWNRVEPLSLQLVATTVFTPPVDGSFLAHRRRAWHAAAARSGSAAQHPV